MPVFRRRRKHYLTSSFSEVAGEGYFSDDAKQNAYYFDNALAKRYVTED